jgi:hypothetical protein
MLRSILFGHVAWLTTVALVAAGCSSGGDARGNGGAIATGSSTTGTSSAAGSGSSGSGTGGSADGGLDGAIPDKTPPTVISTFPVDAATNVAAATAVTATFSKAMASLSLTNATFTLTLGAVAVPGVVTYFDDTATFTPTAALDLGAMYTATITTGATDVSGDPLAAKYSWGFTTAATAAIGPAPVVLGAAGGYVILAKSAISNVPTSAITGNVGISPAAASYVTGFSLTRAGTKWTSPQIVGGVFAADNDPPTPTNLTVAIGSMQTAYTDAAGRPTPGFLNLGGGAIGGLTLTPGLYKWTSGAPNDTWIFQVEGDLTISAAKHMLLSGGARAKNVVWQVTGQVNIGANAHGEGTMLSQTAIELAAGASVNGRLFAQTAVNLASDTVTVPAP